MGYSAQSYGASPAVWDYAVLPATRHGWACPATVQALQNTNNRLQTENSHHIYRRKW